MTAEEIQVKADRRARREARRERQRALNLIRAKQMHAARLAREALGPLTAPPSRPTTKPPAAHIGCSGWYYWHWKYSLYVGLASRDWFPRYASQFNTVELNAPFYAWPTVATVQTWLRQAAPFPGFTYTVKVSELITHIKRFTGTKTLTRDFAFIADLLGERFGSFLYQLPPSYHYTPARLRAIAAQLGPLNRLTNVIEFRHRSWWNEAVYRAFGDANLTFCSISAPRLPDDLVQTSDIVYLRFHGPTRWYRHDYTDPELMPWVQKLKRSKCKQVFAYFNNDRDGNAPRNAAAMGALLRYKRPARPRDP